MTDMYEWLGVVDNGMLMPFEPGETVRISKDFGGGVGQFVGFNPSRGKAIVNVKGSHNEYTLADLESVVNPATSYYVGNTGEQRYDELQNGTHYLPDKPELQPGQMVKIDGLYSAGNGQGFGVFQAYSLDGQSALCNVDSKVLSFHIDKVTPAQEEIQSDTFADTNNDGSLSPMSFNDNRSDVDAQVDARMLELEKWMQVMTNGRFRKTDAGKPKWKT